MATEADDGVDFRALHLVHELAGVVCVNGTIAEDVEQAGTDRQSRSESLANKLSLPGLGQDTWPCIPS